MHLEDMYFRFCMRVILVTRVIVGNGSKGNNQSHMTVRHRNKGILALFLLVIVILREY